MAIHWICMQLVLISISCINARSWKRIHGALARFPCCPMNKTWHGIIAFPAEYDKTCQVEWIGGWATATCYIHARERKNNAADYKTLTMTDIDCDGAITKVEKYQIQTNFVEYCWLLWVCVCVCSMLKYATDFTISLYGQEFPFGLFSLYAYVFWTHFSPTSLPTHSFSFAVSFILPR